MPTYAGRTDVPTERSRAELERTLRRYGAEGYAYGFDGTRAVYEFVNGGRRIRFVLPVPSRSAFRYTPARRYERSEAEIDKAWDQAQRQAWRALVLVVKAKLEAVEAGIAEFEDEFLAYIVLPDGRTASEHVRPAIAAAYDTGKVAPMLALPEGIA